MGDGVPADLLGVGAFAVLIVCWGVAITKYRLFDIDVIVSKSVTYLGLGAAITVLYAAVVTGPLLVLGGLARADPVSDAALGESAGVWQTGESV